MRRLGVGLVNLLVHAGLRLVVVAIPGVVLVLILLPEKHSTVNFSRTWLAIFVSAVVFAVLMLYLIRKEDRIYQKLQKNSERKGEKK